MIQNRTQDIAIIIFPLIVLSAIDNGVLLRMNTIKVRFENVFKPNTTFSSVVMIFLDRAAILRLHPFQSQTTTRSSLLALQWFLLHL